MREIEKMIVGKNTLKYILRHFNPTPYNNSGYKKNITLYKLLYFKKTDWRYNYEIIYCRTKYIHGVWN